MLNLIKNIFLLLFSLVLFTTCKKENMCDCFKGTGSETSETRELGAFDEILVQDKMDVHISKGTNYSAKIEGGKNVIKLIKTKIENGVLTLSDDNRCDFTRSYKKKITVYITVPNLNRIQQDGLGDVYMDTNFVCDTFRYAISNSGNLHLDINSTIVFGGMHGNGDIFMKGIVGENVVHAIGQGFYHGYDVTANNVILTLRTSGKMEVNVNSFLKIDMLNRSTGDILYKGYPTSIYKNIQGTGKLVEQN
ncbi:MAG: head GIN domain-containing protein [Bacteroidota bacterium]|nr:head GIN domain-containing protein [Bacteroidota bacterium]